MAVLFSVPLSSVARGIRPPLRQNRTCSILLFWMLVVPSSIKAAYLRCRRVLRDLSTCSIWAELPPTRKVTLMFGILGSIWRMDLLTLVKSYRVAFAFLVKPQVSILL